MTKPIKPQDEFNEAQIARAIGFSASIFFQGAHRTLRYFDHDCADARGEAFTAARLMNDLWGSQNGRKASIYAITPEGWTIFLCNPHDLDVIAQG